MQLLNTVFYLSAIPSMVAAAALPSSEAGDVAARSSKFVRSITAPSNASSEFSATIELKYDEPTDPVVARQHVDDIIQGGSSPIERRLGPAYLSCEGSGDYSDTNGKLSLQYTCTPSYPIAWGFKVSALVQKIIVGNINEQGLSWWRNGVRMPQNAPHSVYKGYLIHGTMTGANPNSKIQYQDYITFRHNLGSGGTGSIAWSGEVHTLRD